MGALPPNKHAALSPLFSQVAALAAAGGTPVDNDKPYAELW